VWTIACTRNPGGAELSEAYEALKDRELKIWNDLLSHAAHRECAVDHWVGELIGHANALARLGIIDANELMEMMQYADAAYSYVVEELATREWLQLKAAKKLSGDREG
jgi:hypothetical protein